MVYSLHCVAQPQPFWKYNSSIAIQKGDFITVASAKNGNLYAGVIKFGLFASGIYKSMDEGVNWTNCGLSDKGIFEALAVDTLGNIYAGTRDFGLFRSTDDGFSWQNFFDRMAITTINVDRENNIYCGISGGGIYKSLDGGDTWLHMTYKGNDVLCVSLDSENNILIGTYGSGIYKSSDNGITWANKSNGLFPIDTTTSIKTILFLNTSEILLGQGTYQYGGGPRIGGIYQSTDNANHWQKVDTGFSVGEVYSFGKHPSGNIFAATWNAGILQSTDNGATWFQNTTMNANSLIVTDSGTIVCVNYSGIFRSTDIGKTWIQCNSEPLYAKVNKMAATTGRIFALANFIEQSNLSGIYIKEGIYNWKKVSWATVDLEISSDNYIYVVASYNFGDGGYKDLLCSTDFGSSWKSLIQEITYPYGGIYGIASAAQGNLAVVTAGNGVIKSTNHGNTWIKTGFPKSKIGQISIDSLGNILTVVSDSIYYYSQKNDEYFVLNCPFNGSSVTSIYIQPSNNYFIVGTSEGLYYSTDNGLSWFKIHSSPIQIFKFNSDGILYILIDGQGIFYTKDLGKNWIDANSGIPYDDIITFTLTTDNYLVAATSKGIYQSIDPTVTAVREHNLNLPNGTILSQNYPNPFNPSTTILFSLQTKLYTSLKIFDAIGREVVTLVAKELESGEYSVVWDANYCPSGLYFYRLQSGSYTETKKLLLLR